MVMKYYNRVRRRSSKKMTIKTMCVLQVTKTTNETIDDPSGLSSDINQENKESEAFKAYLQGCRKHFFDGHRKMQFVN